MIVTCVAVTKGKKERTLYYILGKNDYLRYAFCEWNLLKLSSNVSSDLQNLNIDLIENCP